MALPEPKDDIDRLLYESLDYDEEKILQALLEVNTFASIFTKRVKRELERRIAETESLR